MKVSDFGLARILQNVQVDDTGTVKTDSDAPSSIGREPTAEGDAMPARDAGDGGAISTPGAPLGTMDYMSPEQRKGGDVDTRSDTYSLGIVAFELLIGRRPEGIEYPHRLRSDLPEAVTEVIHRALGPVDQRQSLPMEFVSELAEAMGDAAVSTGGVERSPVRAGKIRALVLGLIAVAATVAFFGIHRSVALPGRGWGGRAPGMVFGVTALVTMMGAGLVGVLGRARRRTDGKALMSPAMHTGFGTLCLLFALYHSGFRMFGGPAMVAMILLWASVLTGIVGGHVEALLLRLLGMPMAEGALLEDQFRQAHERLLAMGGQVFQNASAGSARAPAGLTVLRSLFERTVRPYLEREGDARASRPRMNFARTRLVLPERFRPAMEQFEGLCRERGQLDFVRRIARVWRRAHALLSFAALGTAYLHIIQELST